MTPHADITRFMRVLFDEARRSGVERPIFEVRILHAGRDKTISGYFDDAAKAAAAIAQRDGTVQAIYVTPNPTHVDCFARAANKLKPFADSTTSDAQIARREWFLIDVDPVRPKGVSSTNVQHGAALARAREIRLALAELGWPAPILADSGNGAHLMYRVDAPNDSEATTLFKGALEALGRRFDDAIVKVDATVFNAARIWKVYGTMACKGDDLPEQPHRRAALLEVPDVFGVCTIDGLRVPAWTWPAPPAEIPQRKNETPARLDFDLRDYLRTHGNLELGAEKQLEGGGWIREITPCPWGDHEKDRAAFVGQRASGAIIAGCRHERCKDKRWSDLREILEPGGGQRKLSAPPPHADHEAPWNGQILRLAPDAPDAEKEPERRHASVLVSSLIDELLREGALPLIPTGLPALDRALDGGLRARTVAVIVGGPGAGKSSLGLQAAAHYADLGGTVLYYTGELTRGQLAARVIGQRKHRRWGEVMSGAVPREEMEQTLASLRLYVLRRSLDPIKAITEEADILIAAAGGVVLVVVDYAQLLADTGAKDFRAGMTEAANALLHLAEGRDVVVLILSQGSRVNARKMREGDGEAADFMDVSAETSAWERNASTVIALTGGAEKGVDGSRLVTAMVAKGRMTGDARVGLRFYGATGVWEEVGSPPQSAAEKQVDREDAAVLAVIHRHVDGIALRSLHGLVLLGTKVLGKTKGEDAVGRLIDVGKVERRPTPRPFNGGIRVFDLLFAVDPPKRPEPSRTVPKAQGDGSGNEASQPRKGWDDSIPSPPPQSIRPETSRQDASTEIPPPASPTATSGQWTSTPKPGSCKT